MAYRERSKGSGRTFRQRSHRNDDGGRYSNNETTATEPIATPIVLKRRPQTDSTSETSLTPSSSLLPISSPGKLTPGLSPKDNGVKAPLVLQRTRNQEVDNATSSHRTPLPVKTENKPKEKFPLLNLLRPYSFPQAFAIPFIDNTMKLVGEGQLDFLTKFKKSKDFLVVAAIGPPHSGKSTILSYLAENTKFGDGKVFPPRKRSQEKECSVYVSSKNIIYIEMASVFNGSAAADLVNTVGHHGNLETAIMSWNLRLMRWILSISHIVILVSESMINPNLLQLLSTAEMINPMESAFGDGSYPEVLFVCNKVPLSCTEDVTLKSRLEEMFRSAVRRPARFGRTLFFLPHKKFTSHLYENRYEELKTAMKDLNIYFRAPFAEDQTQGFQKVYIEDWFENVNRFWDELSQPNYFTNYAKLFP